MKTHAMPIAVTMGEPGGIGGEISLKAWIRRHELKLPPFFLIDDPLRLNSIATRLNWNVPIKTILAGNGLKFTEESIFHIKHFMDSVGA